MTKLLEIDNLHVSFSTRHGVVEALHGITLSLDEGMTLGLVGESGSGKSVTALAIMRLLDRAGKITDGRILYRGTDLTCLREKEMRKLRGTEISMIFQDPRAALNPIRPVGLQIADAIRSHRDISVKKAREEALDLLKAVMIRDPEDRLEAFPHELSGGMCQRIMIAMAISCEPEILIADESTTGLDVTTQKTVMELLARITVDRGMAMILITHDLGLAAQYCQEISVMEHGHIVEKGKTRKILGMPEHPYSRRLIAASPTPTSTMEDLARAAAAAGEEFTYTPAQTCSVPELGDAPILEVQNVVKKFGPDLKAVDDVSFKVLPGTSLGIVGESGSGKSTLSRMICRLLDVTEGQIFFDGESIGDVSENAFHKAPQRRDIQIVFQDPGGSLNPRFTAFDSIAQPLKTLDGIRDAKILDQQVRRAAERSGLPHELLSRFPHQLSGGQKARVGIARAIALHPKLLILDEPTAALDVSVQAIILNLLDRLRKVDGMTFVFVSHDLNVVRLMCENVIVLKTGKIVEVGTAESLFATPKTEYTKKLLAAIPNFSSESDRTPEKKVV